MRRNGRGLVLAVTGIVAGATLVSGPAHSTEPPRADSRPSGAAMTARAAATTPALRVTRVVGRLDIPWDVKRLPGGRLLITERTAKRLLTWRKGRLRVVRFPSSMVWASGETGLMSLAVDPQFRRNRRFYTCQGGYRTGGHDVRVVAWRLNDRATRARFQRTLRSGLPATSGRHGGCRLLIQSTGALIVGTGDAAVGTNPRNRSSLGGKTLRLNRFTGAPWPSNPFIRSSSVAERYVLTYGHRNVQGLAQRSDGSLWSVEHGPDRDDEVNRLTLGGDFGWNPVPGYNENVPMTDQDLDGTQVDARWSSGVPTTATSGAAWVSGSAWGSYNGALAVASLKGQQLSFMQFDSAGNFRSAQTPAALRRYGRLRSVTRLPDGDLLVTTSNGSRTDSVLRVHPVG
jgi:glucose/arabinose dehydrogenase